MIPADYTVKTVLTPSELERVYRFVVSVLGEMERHTLAYYQKHFQSTPTLLVYTEADGRVIGCALASIDGEHVLVGPVAVAESARRMGIGSAMLRRMEVEARKLGLATLILGARREAEDFYIQCGFRPNLFIQTPEEGALEFLKQRNPGYLVVWEAAEGGWSKLMLATPLIDRGLQMAYERQFPGCTTQTVFIKEIG